MSMFTSSNTTHFSSEPKIQGDYIISDQHHVLLKMLKQNKYVATLNSCPPRHVRAAFVLSWPFSLLPLGC